MGFLLLTVAALLVGVTWVGVTVLDGTRGYVTGEGHYIKAQKDALNALVRYAQTGNEEHWRTFESEIEVARAGGRARRALQSDPPDLERARQELLVGRNHPEDLTTVIQLFFGADRVPEMARGIEYWEQADVEVQRLVDVSSRVRDAVRSGSSRTTLRPLLEEAYTIHRTLAGIGNDFSMTLGRASRRFRRQVVLVLTMLAGFLLALSILVALRLVRRLRRSDQIFRQMIDYGHDIVVFRAEDGTALYANPAAERILGLRPEEIVGRNLNECLDEQERDRLTSEFGDFLAGRADFEQVVVRVLDAQGEARTLEVTANRVEGFGPTGTAVLAARDVTERQSLERQILEIQRLESLGRLAGGVAHEYNNLLTTIEMSAGTVRSEVEDSAGVHEELDLVLKAADKAATLTRQLLAISDQHREAQEPVALHQLLESTRRTVSHLLRQAVDLTVTSDGEPLWTMGNAAQLEQVLVNLLMNGQDALPAEGGQLELELRHEGKGQAVGSAVFAVRDNGSGIAVEVRERMFEPFFTTKRRGRGTGLGLAICQGVINDHGGSLEVSSRPGYGSEFRCILPLIAAPVESSPPAVVSPPAGTTARLLLVEDEEGVRRVAQRVLERSGYHVVTAVDGRQGLEIWEELRGEIDLVVSDVVMPRLGGIEMVDRIRRDAPHTRVLFMSGYQAGAMVGWGEADAVTSYLDKPFRPEVLLEAVQSLVGDSSPSARGETGPGR